MKKSEGNSKLSDLKIVGHDFIVDPASWLKIAQMLTGFIALACIGSLSKKFHSSIVFRDHFDVDVYGFVVFAVAFGLVQGILSAIVVFVFKIQSISTHTPTTRTIDAVSQTLKLQFGTFYVGLCWFLVLMELLAVVSLGVAGSGLTDTAHTVPVFICLFFAACLMLLTGVEAVWMTKTRCSKSQSQNKVAPLPSSPSSASMRRRSVSEADNKSASVSFPNSETKNASKLSLHKKVIRNVHVTAEKLDSEGKVIGSKTFVTQIEEDAAVPPGTGSGSSPRPETYVIPAPVKYFRSSEVELDPGDRVGIERAYQTAMTSGGADGDPAKDQKVSTGEIGTGNGSQIGINSVETNATQSSDRLNTQLTDSEKFGGSAPDLGSAMVEHQQILDSIRNSAGCDSTDSMAGIEPVGQETMAGIGATDQETIGQIAVELN